MNLKKICLQNEEKADIVGKGKYKQNGFGMQKREESKYIVVITVYPGNVYPCGDKTFRVCVFGIL